MNAYLILSHSIQNFSLYQKIDFLNLECLNESEEGSGKRVFRPWQNRLDKGETDFVSSDCDAELLFNLPFTGNIKLKVNVMYIDMESRFADLIPGRNF